jgi:hypothetical protein
MLPFVAIPMHLPLYSKTCQGSSPISDMPESAFILRLSRRMKPRDQDYLSVLLNRGKVDEAGRSLSVVKDGVNILD